LLDDIVAKLNNRAAIPANSGVFYSGTTPAVLMADTESKQITLIEEVFTMKRITLINSALILLLFATLGLAQPRMGQMNDDDDTPGRGPGRAMARLDLTDEQQTKVDKIFLEFQKEMMPLHNKLQTLHSEFRMLVIDDKASTSTLQKKLDEIAVVQKEVALKHAEHHRQIRALLTDVQKVKFDAGFLKHDGPGMGGKGFGKHSRMGRNCGPCFRQ
jgi:Spy/CpxP family protein refolding chaperone